MGSPPLLPTAGKMKNAGPGVASGCVWDKKLFMKAVIGLLLLLTVTLLSACSSEPAPEPTPAPPAETPLPAADARAPEPAATPKPKATPAPASTLEPKPALSLDLTQDTTWSQVITALSPKERDCIRNAIDRQALADLSRSTLVWPDDEDLAEEWTPVIFACLAPDTARALYASLVLAFLEPVLAEVGITLTAEHQLCAQEKISDVDVVAVLVAEDDEAGIDVWGRIVSCFPVYMAATFVGMPGMGVYLKDDQLACVREWYEGIDWDTMWASEDGAGFMSILPGLADCSPDLVLNMVLQESSTRVTFWDLDDVELDCLREGMTALDWASIPLGEKEGMAALADAVKLSQCVSPREAPQEIPQAPREFSAADDGSLLWYFPMEDPVASSPTVVDGVLYFGSEDHRVYALDAATGDPLWSFETGDAVWAAPTVTDNAVYFGSDDEYVYALDRETGELLWEHHTRDWVEYSPRFRDGIVYILSGTYEKRQIQARDGKTGRVLWAVEMPDTKRPPAVIGGKIYVIGGKSGKVHALDASSGELQYVLDIEEVDSPPVVIGGVAYLTGYDAAYAVDEASGEILWSYAPGIPSGSPAVVEDGVFYFAPDRHVYALDAATGEVLWSYLSDGPIPRRPVVAGGMVLLSSIPRTDLGQLRALDAASGEVVWSQEPTGGYVRSLAVVDGVLYVEDTGGFLRAIDPATGEDVWEFQWSHQFDGSSYTVVDGVVYVGSTGGKNSGMYAFTAPSPGD